MLKMERDRSWKKADYPNAIPSWRKHPIDYKEEKTQVERVLADLDYNKLAGLGKEEIMETELWKCRADENWQQRGRSGKFIFCESAKGDLLSAFDDGSIRFSKDNCEIKVDGKLQKGKCGVELS